MNILSLFLKNTLLFFFLKKYKKCCILRKDRQACHTHSHYFKKFFMLSIICSKLIDKVSFHSKKSQYKLIFNT